MIRNIVQVVSIVTLALCCLSGNSQSDRKDIFFDRYGPEQGLNTREVRTMVQSSDDFIWMITKEGLVRYDGEEFTLIFDQNVSTDISNSAYIKTMMLDEQDRIWMAFMDILVVYDIHHNSWHYLRDSTGAMNVLPLNFDFDHQHRRMWIGSNRGLCFADDSFRLKWFSFSESKYDTQSFIVLGFQNDTALWLGNTYGYYRLNPLNGQVNVFHTPFYKPEKPNAEGLISGYLMGDSILWIGGWGTGLIKHDLRTNKASQYYYLDPQKGLNGVFDLADAVIKGDKHWLWAGTHIGLMAVNINTGEFLPYYTTDPFDFSGVTGIVYSLLHEAEGALWIGSSDGLFRYDPQNQEIENILFPEFEICNPPDNIAFEKQEGHPERIWFTIPYCDWHIYKPESKKTEPFPKLLQQELKDVGIFTMHIDHSNKLWIGTNERGLVVYDIPSDRFTSYSGKFFLGSLKWATEIVEDPSHGIWVASYDGLFRFDSIGQRFLEVEPVRKLIDEGKITSHITAMAHEGLGKTWAITHFNNAKNSSLICYETATNKISYYDRSNTEAFKRVHEFRDIVTAHNGSVFISTDRGLFVMSNGDIHTLTDFPEFSINPGPSTGALVVDQHDGVWISSAFGISRLSQENNTLYTYNYTTSLLGRVPNPSIWFDSYSRQVYVAQKGSMNVIETTLPKRRKVKLQFLDLFINLVRVDTTDRMLLKLKYDQNDIKIRLALPYFSDSDNNQFRYKLDGYDGSWMSSNSGTIIYNNLPPGAYTFHAIGITSEGQESSNAFVLPFNIRPPFWKTLWFQLGLFVFITGLITAFFLYRDLQRKRLQKMRDAIARDLHDDMGSNLSTIKLLSELELLKNQGDGQQPLKTIVDKTNLVMESMYEIIWSINSSTGRGYDIIEKVKSHVIQTLEPLDIRIRFEQEEPTIVHPWRSGIEVRRDIYLIFKEAVNNIAKYAHATDVVLGVKKEKEHFVMILSDNGVGFDQNDLHNGNGLANMKSRAIGIGGSLDIRSSSGHGTDIILRMPLG